LCPKTKRNRRRERVRQAKLLAVPLELRAVDVLSFENLLVFIIIFNIKYIFIITHITYFKAYD
jgi:hypothetical protein